MSSRQKLSNVAPVPIQLVDEDFEEPSDGETPLMGPSSPKKNSKAISTWATDVHIGECTIVNGSNHQRFAVWSISIDTCKGGNIRLLKRYSEFDSLRASLVSTFPEHLREIPSLPPKKVFGNLKSEFLAKRRRGLEYFMSCVLLNPVLGNSELVKTFVSTSSQ